MDQIEPSVERWTVEVAQLENLCLEFKLVHFKILELNLITGLILELLYILVS